MYYQESDQISAELGDTINTAHLTAPLSPKGIIQTADAVFRLVRQTLGL